MRALVESSHSCAFLRSCSFARRREPASRPPRHPRPGEELPRVSGFGTFHLALVNVLFGFICEMPDDSNLATKFW
jgi:hypothetical protein